MAVEIMAKDECDFFAHRLGLSSEEKEELKGFLRRERGKEAIRALIILWFNEGRTEAEIADLLGVSVRTVRRWIKRYKEGGIEGLHDRERTGRPRKADKNVGKEVEEVIEKNPEVFGYKSGFWTVNLLCIHLSAIFGLLLSNSTVRRVLHRLGYVFRRPKLWSGPGGEIPYEIEGVLNKEKKAKQSYFMKMRRAFTSFRY
jgi:transposase